MRHVIEHIEICVVHCINHKSISCHHGHHLSGLVLTCLNIHSQFSPAIKKGDRDYVILDSLVIYVSCVATEHGPMTDIVYYNINNL